jgi:hypothetical protein
LGQKADFKSRMKLLTSRCTLHFSSIAVYSKYCGIFDPKYGPQYVGLAALRKGGLDNSLILMEIK